MLERMNREAGWPHKCVSDAQGLNSGRQTKEISMLRKTILALTASAALGSAALAPTSASAHWGGGWHGGWGYRPFVRVYAGPAYAYGYGGCTVRRWVYTPYGAVLRWVNVC
jgi:hypothetical protein